MRVNFKTRHWIRKLFPTARRLLVERSLSCIPLSNFENVLIVGAGHDPYRNLFSGAKRYITLDIMKIEKIIDVIGDTLTLPFVESSFDCIFASEVMEHLSNPFLFVENITRVLKPGGTLVITIPFMFHYHADPYDYWRPTGKSLQQLFSSFSEFKIVSQGTRLHVIWDLLTTAFYPNFPVLLPLRILNHLLVYLPGSIQQYGKGSTAPSGFLVMAKK